MTFETGDDAFLEAAATRAATNGVRDASLPTAEILRFPLEAIIRPQPGCRGDQLVLIHRGAVLIYDNPEVLESRLRETDPELLALRADAKADAALARDILAQARITLGLSDAAKALAERRLRRIGWGAIAAVVLAAVCLLGAR